MSLSVDSQLVVAPETVASSTSTPGLLRRSLHRKIAVAALVYLAALVAVAIIAPVVLPNIADQHAGDLLAARQGPSAHHLLGTDTLGRDVLDRLLVGTRVTLLGVGEALIVVLILGVPAGLVAGYFGGWADRSVSWLADLTFSVPAIVIVVVVLAVFPQSMLAAMCALGLLCAPGLMRVVRSATLPIRHELYVAAAEVSGLSRRYILAHHIFPRISGAVIVQASLLAALALLVQSGLAFLGLVVAAPAPSWGGMVADGVSALELQSWLIWPPGLAIAITILAFGLLGDAVRDASTETWAGEVPYEGTSRRKAKTVVAPDASLTPSSVIRDRREPLLSVEDLGAAFPSKAGPRVVLDSVTFDVGVGETVGLVGESGCGKTLTAFAILGLLPGHAQVTKGAIRFAGRDLTQCDQRELRRVRGKEIAMVSQEPMISLNPAFRVVNQLAEAVRHHNGGSRQQAHDRAMDLLARVHLTPQTVARRYPHELSGGMAQRVAIARALAGHPKLLIADEPTTALDVTVQADILDLLQEIQNEEELAILLVTHDWGVVGAACQRAVTMYAGQVVERGPLESLFDAPLHPYTAALLASNPFNVPVEGSLPTIPGSVPRPGFWPRGCHFHPRCRYATSACSDAPIAMEHPSADRETRCIHYEVFSHHQAATR